MSMSLRPPHSRQRGITLISLMTGLAISMILVLATLMLFQRIVRTTTDARVDARDDAQRNAAFLSMNIALQEAGYGVASAAAGTHLVVLSGAELSGASLSGTSVAVGQTGNAVVWTENTAGATQCSALLASAQTGLHKLGPVACANAAAFAGLTWTDLPLSAAPVASAAITWAGEPCTPFGIASHPGDNRILLTLSAANSNGVLLDSSQCLTNVSP